MTETYHDSQLQLSSGTTAFNTTLNLTGHILLGLGIASSLLMYMFLKALQGGGEEEGGYGAPSTGYGGRRKVPQRKIATKKNIQ